MRRSVVQLSHQQRAPAGSEGTEHPPLCVRVKLLSTGPLGKRIETTMRYLSKDISCFVRTSPYLKLAKPRSAVSFLKCQVEAAEECHLTLRSYPVLQIEPLEFFYMCLRSLGALDLAFFEALVRDHTWRGVVWAAWLALLEPRAEFADALRTARSSCPSYNKWLVDCALSAIEGRAPAPAHAIILELAARCRRSLDGVARPTVWLRWEPTAAQIAQIATERDRIRCVYAENGMDAALRCLPGTLVGFYAMDHVRWLRLRASQPVPPIAAHH